MRELTNRAQASGNPNLLLQANVHSLRWTGGDKSVGNSGANSANDKNS
jgi:hypothetical protein